VDWLQTDLPERKGKLFVEAVTAPGWQHQAAATPSGSCEALQAALLGRHCGLDSKA
jgi:hypothetical protein